MAEKRLPSERIYAMHATGRRRAISGRPIVTEAVLGIQQRERIREYLFGYISFVEESLAGIGIEGPSDIGIHESYQHVVVQDPSVEGLSGIEGLNDGMRLKEEDVSFSTLGYSEAIHYKDGYKIGTAFARANVRRGNFEAIPAMHDISDRNVAMIKPEIDTWLNDYCSKLDKDMILFLNPIVRLAFAHCVMNDNSDHSQYLSNLIDRVEKNAVYSGEVKKNLIQGIKRSPNLALKAKTAFQNDRRSKES